MSTLFMETEPFLSYLADAAPRRVERLPSPSHTTTRLPLPDEQLQRSCTDGVSSHTGWTSDLLRRIVHRIAASP